MEEGSELESSSHKLTLGEYIREICPYYLSIGVTWDEFWHGDYTRLKYYRKAHELKQQEANYNAWLQGAYFYEALCDVAPILHAFAKAGTKPIPYREKPYGKESQEENEKKAAEIEFARFQAFAAKFNKDFRERHRVSNKAVTKDGRSRH